MYVAFVTDTWPPEVNGVALTVRGLACGLAARGHQIEVIRPGGTSRDGTVTLLPAVGVPLPRYPGMRVGLPQGCRLRQRWRTMRPDAVYIATEGLLGLSAMRVANRLGIPVVSGFHTRFDDYAAHYGLGVLTRWVRRRLIRFHQRAQMTLVPTAELRDELLADSVGHACLLRRGVDTRLFTPARRDPALRRRWGVQADDPVMLCVGRLAAEKYLDLALRCLTSMQALQPSARLVLVGDGPERARLQAACPDAVFAGVQQGEALAACYASADAFVFPSRTETFGNVVLEAMASGLPVVAFDRAAAREHVTHQCSGLVLPEGDDEAFIKAAHRLSFDVSLRRQLGDRARRDAEHLSPGAVLAEFEQLLVDLAAGRQTSELAHAAV